MWVGMGESEIQQVVEAVYEALDQAPPVPVAGAQRIAAAREDGRAGR